MPFSSLPSKCYIWYRWEKLMRQTLHRKAKILALVVHLCLKSSVLVHFLVENQMRKRRLLAYLCTKDKSTAISQLAYLSLAQGLKTRNKY